MRFNMAQTGPLRGRDGSQGTNLYHHHVVGFLIGDRHVTTTKTLQIGQAPGEYLLGRYYEFLTAGGGISGQCLTVDGGVLHPLMSRNVQTARLKTDGYA